MGDLMHALPALTDACEKFPGITFDWVVDESFAEVPAWHPAVNNIYTSAHRRWKKNFLSSLKKGEFSGFYRNLNAGQYDVIIDAQNNIKSSFISLLRKGPVHGMDRNSVPEKPAHLAYHFKHAVSKDQHAIARQRQLFAEALGYEVPATQPDYGLKPDAFRQPDIDLPESFLFLVHNASWSTKLWPEEHWDTLIQQAAAQGYSVVLPGGSQHELERAASIAARHDNATALPRMSLSELGGVIQQAAGAVCCDTGLAHLAAMTGTPAVTLYGPTSVELIGTTGQQQFQLGAANPPFKCAPCYQRYCDYQGEKASMSACMAAFTPEQVWQQLREKL